jgi:hypothetical protein
MAAVCSSETSVCANKPTRFQNHEEYNLNASKGVCFFLFCSHMYVYIHIAIPSSSHPAATVRLSCGSYLLGIAIFSLIQESGTEFNPTTYMTIPAFPCQLCGDQDWLACTWSISHKIRLPIMYKGESVNRSQMKVGQL